MDNTPLTTPNPSQTQIPTKRFGWSGSPMLETKLKTRDYGIEKEIGKIFRKQNNNINIAVRRFYQGSRNVECRNKKK